MITAADTAYTENELYTSIIHASNNLSYNAFEDYLSDLSNNATAESSILNLADTLFSITENTAGVLDNQKKILIDSTLWELHGCISYIMCETD